MPDGLFLRFNVFAEHSISAASTNPSIQARCVSFTPRRTSLEALFLAAATRLFRLKRAF